MPNTPLYPFGYGLSYSSFDTELKGISQEGNFIHIDVDVTNTSTVDGSEIVQLYYRDVLCSYTRPVKQLCRFLKVDLKQGEKRNIRFDIYTQELGFFDNQGNWIIEKGDFEFFVGPSSQDLEKVDFVLK